VYEAKFSGSFIIVKNIFISIYIDEQTLVLWSNALVIKPFPNDLVLFTLRFC